MSRQPTRELVLRSDSPEVTLDLAASMARVARPGDVVCLWGELGAGKTVFAKGFGSGLAISTAVRSPSFILVAEHAGRLRLFHLDLYRLAGADEALAGGLLDERQAAGVTLVEWPDRLGFALPKERLDVVIDGRDDAARTIRLRAMSPEYERFLDAAIGSPRLARSAAASA